MSRIRFLLLALLVVAGCASRVPKEVVSQATFYGDFADLRSSSDRYTGQFAILGGRVVETQSDSSQTLLTVLQYPLDSSHRPKVNEPSAAAFWSVPPPSWIPPFTAPGVWSAWPARSTARRPARRRLSIHLPCADDERDLEVGGREGTRRLPQVSVRDRDRTSDPEGKREPRNHTKDTNGYFRKAQGTKE